MKKYNIPIYLKYKQEVEEQLKKLINQLTVIILS